MMSAASNSSSRARQRSHRRSVSSGRVNLFLTLLLCSRGGFAADREGAGVVYRNIAPGVAYVGSRVCAGCHQDIYNQYAQTDMGRSMSTVTSTLLEKVPTPVTIFDKGLNRHFEVYRRGGDLYERESETRSDGKEVFRDTQKIEWIIGSGANGFSPVVRRGNYLFEAPLSFYSKPNTWGLSPGYEFHDYGFTRPILPGCIVCHSGQPQPVAGGNGRYQDLPFRELAIGCENCHGPGELHLNERLKGAPISGEIDASIVNPAKLAPWLADNICMSCHQTGDVRVLKRGKDYRDFRPGTPLDSTLAILMVPLNPKSPPQSDLLEHYFSMTLSKCYRASDGRLSCLTCHDPHYEPSKQEAPPYFQKKCLSCHTEKSCAVPLAIRLHKDPPDDCSGCHMPKRYVKIIAHSALTNHRIVAEAEEPYPDAAFHLTTPQLPDLIHLNAIPNAKDAVPPLTLLEAYREVMGSHPAYRQRYAALLKQLVKTEPDNILVVEALAQEAVERGTPEGAGAAIRYFERAIELGSTSPTDLEELAGLLARSSRTTEAIDVLKKAVALVPYDVQLYRSLAENYFSLNRPAEAVAVLNQAVQLFPQDSAIRTLLQKSEETTRRE